MKLPDVNVVLAGFRPDHPHHEVTRAWLEDARKSPEPLGLATIVLSSVLRLATNSRVFKRPDTTAATLGYLETLLDEPGLVVPDIEDTWDRFAGLCGDLQLRGNLVPDAHLAAIALGRRAQIVTLDRGFRRFPNLRWRCLLDD